MRTAQTLFSLILIGMVSAPGAVAQVGPKPVPVAAAAAADAGHEADAKAIRHADDAFVKAYNAGDVKALADLFTEDAEATDESGIVIKGRNTITELFAELFEESPGSQIAITVESLRFPAPGVALETGRTKITPADGDSPELGRYTVLFVKKDDKWLQANVQEVFENRVTPHERLAELDWMVGEWVDESDNGVATTSCHWSSDKNYLLRDYTIHIAGKPVMSGTQRIGWDPLARQIRSWIFESDGGHGEGLWARDGNQWIVKLSGALPTGRKATSTQVITFVSKDIARWKSVDRTVGGSLLPDIEEIVLVRKPPVPK